MAGLSLFNVSWAERVLAGTANKQMVKPHCLTPSRSFGCPGSVVCTSTRTKQPQWRTQWKRGWRRAVVLKSEDDGGRVRSTGILRQGRCQLGAHEMRTGMSTLTCLQRVQHDADAKCTASPTARTSLSSTTQRSSCWDYHVGHWKMNGTLFVSTISLRA